ncbi:MAG TPA: ribose-phosphate pyrophosphokinase, partial [Streptosporangiaceae bacterium]|nr:ribose-phosphate pyrophosphokinase [Streptosporangiaceae bacterium]
LFADGALGKLAAQPDVAEVVCTNTVPMPEHKRDDKLQVLSIAPAMGEAIRRIHNGESISSLFDIP